ncbi:hypothetical protein ACFL2Y_04360, partial [Candidatus Omnitrophota bacterium]
DKIFDSYIDALEYSNGLPEFKKIVAASGREYFKTDDGKLAVRHHDGTITDSLGFFDVLGAITGLGMSNKGAALWEARHGGVNWWFRPLNSHGSNVFDADSGFGANNFGRTITNTLFGGNGKYSFGNRWYDSDNVTNVAILRDIRGDGQAKFGQRDIMFIFKDGQKVPMRGTDMRANVMFVQGANYRRSPDQVLFGSIEGGITKIGPYLAGKVAPGVAFKEYFLQVANSSGGLPQEASPEILQALDWLGYGQEGLISIITKEGSSFYEQGSHQLVAFDRQHTFLNRSKIQYNVNLGQGTEAALGRKFFISGDMEADVPIAPGLDPRMTPQQTYTFHAESFIQYDRATGATKFSNADLHVGAQNWHIEIAKQVKNTEDEYLVGNSLLKIANPNLVLRYRGGTDGNLSAGVDSVKFNPGSGRSVLADTKILKVLVDGRKIKSETLLGEFINQGFTLDQKAGVGLTLTQTKAGQWSSLALLPQQINEILPHSEHPMKTPKAGSGSAQDPFLVYSTLEPGQLVAKVEGKIDYANVYIGQGVAIPLDVTKGRPNLAVGEGLRSAVLDRDINGRVEISGMLHMAHNISPLGSTNANSLYMKPGYSDYHFAPNDLGQLPFVRAVQPPGSSVRRLGWDNSQNVRWTEFLTESFTRNTYSAESNRNAQGSWEKSTSVAYLRDNFEVDTLRNFKINQEDFSLGYLGPEYVEEGSGVVRAPERAIHASWVGEGLQPKDFQILELNAFALDEQGYIIAQGSGSQYASLGNKNRPVEFDGKRIQLDPDIKKPAAPDQKSPTKTEITAKYQQMLDSSRKATVSNLQDVSLVEGKNQLIRFVPLDGGEYGVAPLHFESIKLTREMAGTSETVGKFDTGDLRAGDVWAASGNIQNQGSEAFNMGQYTIFGIKNQGSGLFYQTDANNNFHITGYFDSSQTPSIDSPHVPTKEAIKLGKSAAPGDFWMAWDAGKKISLEDMKMLSKKARDEHGVDRITAAGVMQLERALRFNMGFRNPLSVPSFNLAAIQKRGLSEFEPFSGGQLPSDFASIGPLTLIKGPYKENALGVLTRESIEIQPGVYLGDYADSDVRQSGLRANFLNEFRWNKVGGQQGGIGVGVQTIEVAGIPLAVSYPEQGLGAGGDPGAPLPIRKAGITGDLISNSYGKANWGAGGKLDVHDFRGRFEMYVGPMATAEVSTGQSQAYIPALGTVADSKIRLGKNRHSTTGDIVKLKATRAIAGIDKQSGVDKFTWLMVDMDRGDNLKAGWDVAATTKGKIKNIIKGGTGILTSYDNVHFHDKTNDIRVRDLNLRFVRQYYADDKYDLGFEFDKGIATTLGLDAESKPLTTVHEVLAYLDKNNIAHALIEEFDPDNPFVIELDLSKLKSSEKKTGEPQPASQPVSENRSYLEHFASAREHEVGTLSVGRIDTQTNLGPIAPATLSTQFLHLAPGARHVFKQMPDSIDIYIGDRKQEAGYQLGDEPPNYVIDWARGRGDLWQHFDGVGFVDSVTIKATKKPGKFYTVKFSDGEDGARDLRQGQMDILEGGALEFGMNYLGQETQMFLRYEKDNITHNFVTFADGTGLGPDGEPILSSHSYAPDATKVFGSATLDVDVLAVLEGDTKDGNLPITNLVPALYRTNPGSEMLMGAEDPALRQSLAGKRARIYLFIAGEVQESQPPMIGRSQQLSFLAAPEAGVSVFSKKEEEGGVYAAGLNIMSVKHPGGGPSAQRNYTFGEVTKVGDDQVNLVGGEASFIMDDRFSHVVIPRYEFSLSNDLKTFAPAFEGPGAVLRLTVPEKRIVNHFTGQEDQLFYPLGTYKEGVTISRPDEVQSAILEYRRKGKEGKEYRGIDLQISYWKDGEPSAAPDISVLRGNYLRERRFPEGPVVSFGNKYSNFSNRGEKHLLVIDNLVHDMSKKRQDVIGTSVYDFILGNSFDTPRNEPESLENKSGFFGRIREELNLVFSGRASETKENAASAWTGKMDASNLRNYRGEDKSSFKFGMDNWEENDVWVLHKGTGRVYAMDVDDGPLGFVVNRKMELEKLYNPLVLQSNPEYQALSELEGEYFAADGDYFFSSRLHAGLSPLYVVGLGIGGMGAKALATQVIKQGLKSTAHFGMRKLAAREAVKSAAKWGAGVAGGATTLAVGSHWADGEGWLEGIGSGLKDIGGVKRDINFDLQGVGDVGRIAWGEAKLFASGFITRGIGRYHASVAEQTGNALHSLIGNSMAIWAPVHTTALNLMSVLETGQPAGLMDNVKAAGVGTMYGMVFNLAVPMVGAKLTAWANNSGAFSRALSATVRAGEWLHSPLGQGGKITTGANALIRHGIMITGGGAAGVGISSLWANAIDGRPLKGSEMVSAFMKGAILAEIVGFAASPYGVEYIQKISSAITKHGTFSAKTFETLSGLSARGAATWPFVGGTMSAAMPVYDMALVGAGRYIDLKLGLPLDQFAPSDGSLWGFEFKEFRGPDGKPVRTLFRQQLGQTIMGNPIYGPAKFGSRIDDIKYTGDHAFLLAKLDKEWGDTDPIRGIAVGQEGYLSSILGGQVLPSAIESLKHGLYMGPLVGFAGNKPQIEIDRAASLLNLWRTAKGQPFGSGRAALLTRGRFYKELAKRTIGRPFYKQKEDLTKFAEEVMPGGMSRMGARINTFVQKGSQSASDLQRAASFAGQEAVKVPGLVLMAGKVSLIDSLLEAPQAVGRRVEMLNNPGLRPELIDIRPGFGQTERGVLSWVILFALGRSYTSKTHAAKSRGHEAYKRGDLEAARKEFAELAELEPSKENFANLFVVQSQLKDSKGMIGTGNKLIELDAIEPAGWEAIALGHELSGNTGIAVTALREGMSQVNAQRRIARESNNQPGVEAALKTHKTLNEMRNNMLGAEAVRSENFGDAVKHIGKAAKVNPSAENNFRLGLAQQKFGLTSDAIRSFEK